jgi:hypothetical protein
MRKLPSLLALPLLVSACAGASSAASPTPAATYAVGSGSGDLILRVDTGGGLVPVGYFLNHLPEFSLYGDGRIVVPGPVAEIYPSPLLPDVRVMRVTPVEIQRIVAAADQAGLLGPNASYPGTGIYDAPTTIFTLTVAGVSHRIQAYALMAGVKSEKPADDAARARLLAFDDKIHALNRLLGRDVSDQEAFQPAGLRVFVRPAETVDPSEPAPTVLPWPLVSDPAKTGQPTDVPGTLCVLLSGTDLTEFTSTAGQANARTLWSFGTTRYSAVVRPLLPDETGCPNRTPVD